MKEIKLELSEKKAAQWPQLSNLMGRLLSYDPALRPTFNMIAKEATSWT
jgi:hypothetical protein